ncbi:hypothetical protein D3C84_1136910 [compost metagenome]
MNVIVGGDGADGYYESVVFIALLFPNDKFTVRVNGDHAVVNDLDVLIAGKDMLQGDN